jgi:hypothetical protein
MSILDELQSAVQCWENARWDRLSLDGKLTGSWAELQQREQPYHLSNYRLTCKGLYQNDISIELQEQRRK